MARGWSAEAFLCSMQPSCHWLRSLDAQLQTPCAWGSAVSRARPRSPPQTPARLAGCHWAGQLIPPEAHHHNGQSIRVRELASTDASAGGNARTCHAHREINRRESEVSQHIQF